MPLASIFISNFNYCLAVISGAVATISETDSVYAYPYYVTALYVSIDHSLQSTSE
jgi:hypothetical protein